MDGASGDMDRSEGEAAVSEAERECFVAGMLFACLMLAIFLGGMAVGRGMGRVPSEVAEKEGGR